MSDDATTKLPPRPETGFGAWQATLGYISTHHSPDARLILYIYPKGNQVLWAGRAAWGPVVEEYVDAPGLPIVLSKLWRRVEHFHTVFETPADMVRRPVGYIKTEWVDLPTQDILHRILWTVRLAFLEDWYMMIVYQAVENPAMRVHMRLISRSNQVVVGGRGPSLLEAGRDLFRNAAPVFTRHSTDDDPGETR